MSSIDLATLFKIGMYLLNSEKRLNAFPRSTYIKLVLNELPTNKRHIKILQDRLLCHTHVDNKKKQVFKNCLFKCVTRLDPSGVPLCTAIALSYLV